ncbi:hypothetical protein JJB11_20460 [Ramlibacter ginsenosidimutans]|uniref:TonB C-terminal domain-containing protein n=1 Tax=Ramlibacter ginsenosidimutans TaxID=502333 RepID=A0A934TXI4_9BURK|nr:hypothetical protein [Ramlibacter ginsenosidimutans]MBK6008482.1 hypothetical protein [Ramlibacter ginsenosidimutans]
MRSLLPAFAISLLAHVLLLCAGSAKHEGGAHAPVLTVTLTAAVFAPPSPAPDAQRARPAAAPTMQRQPTVTPSARQLAGRAATEAPAAVSGATRLAAAAAPPTAQVARVWERTAAALKLSQRERAFSAVQTMDAPPTPLSRPELGDVGRKVAGRRLQSSVWIAADGSVEKAFVKRNEISDEVAGLLEQALASVRFTPALQDGKPVPSLLQARLCFDDAGALDTAPTECLRPGAGAAAEGASAAPH